MIHIIVATHGGLAQELVQTAQIIVGAQSDLTPVGLEVQEGIEDLKRKFLAVIKPNEAAKEGYLILVDMFGGTPSNVSLALSRAWPVRVVTGANLPMLLEAITHRPFMDLEALAEFASDRGRQGIFNVNNLFPAQGDREG